MAAAGAAMRSSGPAVLSQVDDKISVDDRDIPIRIYKDSKTPDTIIVYYHGGGWCMGALSEYDAPLRRMAKMCNAAVISVDYRLAPEHPFPACIDDAAEALKWVDTQRGTLAKPGAPLIVAGDSAGGNISAVMTQMARDSLGIKIDGQILIYPSVDLDIEHSRLDVFDSPLLKKSEIKWFVEQYVPRPEDRDDVRFRPLLAQSHSNLPQALIFAAEFDLLKPEAEAYRDKLVASGVPVTYHQADGGVHGYFSAMDGQTHAQQAHGAIKSFVRKLATA